MSRTIQIHDLEGDVYAALQVQAAEVGLSVPELLRREALRLAARPTMTPWVELTRRRPSDLSTNETVAALDDLRGPWPGEAR